MKGKILVAGGMGFIGSHTTVELQNAGYDVVFLRGMNLPETVAEVAAEACDPERRPCGAFRHAVHSHQSAKEGQKDADRKSEQHHHPRREDVRQHLA